MSIEDLNVAAAVRLECLKLAVAVCDPALTTHGEILIVTKDFVEYVSRGERFPVAEDIPF